ncbi:endonuclease/exonuclease/phosphatase family protein [Aeromicrobium sp. 179-A 4D2 NHS]|uniref:endonuclease/exonuclease/phosphatase family protein n=1 Tax=Aeromicrobium sp. 179-A 4D2 NHS TaxID=3142375 RepID=UPI0039A239AC
MKSPAKKAPAKPAPKKTAVAKGKTTGKTTAAKGKTTGKKTTAKKPSPAAKTKAPAKKTVATKQVKTPVSGKKTAVKATRAPAKKTPPKATSKQVAKNTTTRKSASKTRNPNGKLVAPTVSCQREEAWSAFWINVKPVHGATAYEMQIARDTAFTDIIDTRFIKRANQRAWFGDLDDGQTYFYRVRAHAGPKQGPWSRVGKRTLSFYGIQTPASDVEAAGHPNHVDVTWTAAESRTKHPLTYRVVMSTDRDGKKPTAEQTTTGTSVRFTDVDQGRRYFFRVYASNRGMRERGDDVPKMERAEAQVIPIDSAKLMRVTNTSPRGFTVGWPVRASNAGHWIEVCEHEFRAEFATALAVPYRGYKGSTKMTINDLEPNTEYWLRAINPDGTNGQQVKIVTEPAKSKLRLGTYNVRYIQLDGPRSEHSWGKRREHVAKIIGENFDILGVQEAASWASSRTYRKRSQIDDLLYLLQDAGPYERFEAVGERSPGAHVVYRTDKVKTLGEGEHLRWKVGTENRGQAMIAMMQTIEGSQPFCFVSVHLSPFVEHHERLEHTAELAEAIRRVNRHNTPVVVVGDMNSHDGRTEETPREYLTDTSRSGLTLVDAEDWSPGRERTMIHSSNTKWLAKVTDHSGFKIDYVLTDERIAVTDWSYVVTWTKGGKIRQPLASDHHAIVVQATL